MEVWSRIALHVLPRIHESHTYSDGPESVHPERSRRTRPLPSSLPPNIELEAEVGAEAPTSASVLLSPSPLKTLSLPRTPIRGERVPRPRAESAYPEHGRRACPESLEGAERRLLKHSQTAINVPSTSSPSFSPLSTKTRGRPMCAAHGSAPVFFSPFPLKALRERGIKGVRVPRPRAPWPPDHA